MQTHGFGGKDRGVLMNRVRVQPALLRWARERSRRSAADLQKRFSRLEAWEQGSTLPTLKQLEAYARATRTPIGYFFLQEPPVEFVTGNGLSHGRKRRCPPTFSRLARYALSLPAASRLV